MKLHVRRFTVEETLRFVEDLRFGMGLSAPHIRSPARRERLLRLAAMTHSPLTLLGPASERWGLDSYLKTSALERRTMSPHRQGAHGYRCRPTMRDEWLERPITACDEVVREHASLGRFLGFERGDGSCANHLRAALHLAGSTRPVPAYLPEALAPKLPLYPRFRVRLLAELHLSEDPLDAHEASLRVVAFGRVVSLTQDGAGAPGR